MERKFGVELEMVGITREQAKQALTLVGINVQAEGYNHITRSHWKIVPDSSVNGGFEVVSPPLQGEAGLEQLRTVITALDDMGGNVNRSCGFHVHFDAADLNVNHIRAIVTRYAAHEAEIDAFMPPSRRGSTNTYCKSVTDLAQSERFRNATTLQELIGAQGGRYFKVNLQSYNTHGTVEFRQHSGTLNAPKAVNWVRLLDAFITQSKNIVDNPNILSNVNLPTLNGVLADLASMFTQGSVTVEAMCQRFNWQVHSARAAITRLRRAGMDIILDRTHGYQLRNVDRTHFNTTNDSLFDGVSEMLQIFYRNRTAVLNAA